MAFSYLIDAIENGTGKYDVEKTYFINNATNEDIEITWAAKEPEAKGHGTYRIKAGETGGPYPQFLAYHIVRALVSREMQKEGKTKFFASAEHRRPYEEKFLKEIVAGTEDPFVAKIREEERQKILAELKKKEESVEIKPEIGTPDVPRRGRPRKEPPQEFEGANI